MVAADSVGVFLGTRPAVKHLKPAYLFFLAVLTLGGYLNYILYHHVINYAWVIEAT